MLSLNNTKVTYTNSVTSYKEEEEGQEDDAKQADANVQVYVLIIRQNWYDFTVITITAPL